MLKYNHHLKSTARRLRINMTDCEQLLWSRLRRKQILDVQFYRQKPIGNYIVDFYAPHVKLVVEIDGAQHLENDHAEKDAKRDTSLTNQGLRVLRFDNMQVLQKTEAVVEVIFRTVEELLTKANSP